MCDFNTLIRCPWPANHALAIEYHDKEWGVAVHDDNIHFEYLVLDAFQAGLSWNTILNKRENFRKAFDNFNFETIAKYNSRKIDELLSNTGIIRNRLKIEATIANAKAFLQIQEKYTSFDTYIWGFVDGKPIINKFNDIKDIPAKTPISDKMSKELKKNGFKFVGSTICYAYMQAAGLVNDHIASCFRYKQVLSNI